MKALKTLSELIASKEVVLADDVQITASINGVVISAVKTEKKEPVALEAKSRSQSEIPFEPIGRLSLNTGGRNKSCYKTGITKESIHAEILRELKRKRMQVPIKPGVMAIPLSISEVPPHMLRKGSRLYRLAYQRIYNGMRRKGYMPAK